MCRLFGLHAGAQPVKATFWLLQATNSLAVQSHYEPDGTGVGTFDPTGRGVVNKQPLSAWSDRAFAEEAKTLESTTFLAHVRYASTGDVTEVNTHPFMEDNRIFAHNGVLRGLPELQERLRALGTAQLVRGQTDSERLFALITGEIRKADEDVTAGITSAVEWMSENLPVYSLNLILTTATDLWALRYPETHDLYVLDRQPTNRESSKPLMARSSRIQAHSPALADRHLVIVATERMTDDPQWRLMEPGELLHVNQDLDIESHLAFTQRPQRMIKLDELDATAAASQHPHTE